MKLKIFAPMILSAIIFLTGCGQQDSPEAALNEIKIALAERDEAKFSANQKIIRITNKKFRSNYRAVFSFRNF